MNFTILLRGGSSVTVSGTHFSFAVQGELHNFVVHKGIANPKLYQVTHLLSGLRVCVIPAELKKDFGRDLKGAGLKALELTRDRVGEARLRSALACAKPDLVRSN